jgi:protein-disulfide isomerase
MKTLIAIAAVISFGALAPVGAQAPAPAGAPTLESLAKQNQDILNELRTIRQLLEKLTGAQPSPSPLTVQVRNSTDFVLGNADAPLTMIEFTDLECPFCREYATTGFDAIKKDWIDTGRLRYLARDVPIDTHVHSLMAARAARCAGDQQRFWEMRTALMKNANLLSADYILKTANALKLDAKTFTACASSTTHDAGIQADLAEAIKLGLRGTPTFVIGRTAPDTIDGEMLVGVQPYAVFDAKLKALLAPASR